MAEPEKAEASEKQTSPGGRIYRRHSATGASEEPNFLRTTSSRRTSLSQGLRDGGQKVAAAVGGAVEAVGALFKDRRGELLDPEDDPEYARSQPAWEDDLNKYLPASRDYTQPWNSASSSSAGPSTASQRVPTGLENVASTSSRPPMVPSEKTGNIALDLLLGISSRKPQTLAASRWHKAYQFVKRQNAMKRKAMSSPLGTGAKLDGRSFGVIPTHDETRQSIFNFWYQSYPATEPSYSFVYRRTFTERVLSHRFNSTYEVRAIIGHILVLILKAETKFVTSFIPPKKTLNDADIALTTLYTMEIVSRIFCLGLWRGPHSYLRSPYNKLDFIIVVDSWVHIARTNILGKDAFFRIAILRIFRILLSVRHFRFVGNVIAIMDSLVKSAWQLRTVFVFTIMIMSFYSMVGVIYLGGSMQNRCVRISDNEVSYPQRTCITNEENPYGYLCPAQLDQYCLPYQNPNWGLSSFDNYASGMLVLFQLMTFEGWALQMYNMNDTNGYTNAFYIIFLIIGSYFIVNIYVAAISSIFLRVRHEHQALLKKHRRDKAFTFAAAIQMANLLKDVIIQDDATVKLSWRQRLSIKTTLSMEKFRKNITHQGSKLSRSLTKAVDWNDPHSYLKRISTFGTSRMDGMELGESGLPPRNRSFGRSFSRNLSMGGREAVRLGRTLSRNISLGVIFAAQTTSQKCYLIVESKAFLYAVLLLISLNMAGLCTFRARIGDDHRKRLEIMEIGMLVIFTLEIILRFVASGSLMNFVDERMNVVDVFVVFITFGATGFGPHKKYPNLTPIRMLRWFYKKNIHNEDLGEDVPVTVAIIRSFGSLASVFFFFTLVILVFSIISMELWGGEFSNFDTGYPRANHDTIFQAMLLWFSVTTAESWPDHMWNTMRPGMPYQYMGPIMFITYYVTTTIIILNLIMAVILEQSELTDNQKKYIQKRDHIKWLQTKHLHHTSSTRRSDWLLGAVEGAQKGYTGVKQRMSTMKVSRTSLFPVLQPETGFVRMMPSPQGGPPASRDALPANTPQIPSALLSEDRPPPRLRYSLGSATGTIPGAIPDPPEVDRGKARIFRRSSLGALSSMGLIPQDSSRTKIQRRPSHDADKVVYRSGFGTMKNIVEGENQTALQKALLNVVQEQKQYSKLVEKEKSQLADVATIPIPLQVPDVNLTKTVLGKMPSRTDKAKDRISFTLAEYEAIKTEGDKAVPWWLSEPSLFIFKPDNRFRIACGRLAGNSFYLYFQYVVIWLSLFIVVEQTQLGWYINMPTKPHIMNSIDYFVLASFSFDFIIKIIAYGFLFAPEAYLGDPFNFIDIFSLAVHICRVKTRRSGEWFNTFLLLSTTRPARFVVRAPGLRRLTVSIIRTVPAITQMFVFTIAIYAIFAVIGMQLYANRFRYCTDNKVTGHFDCVGHFNNKVGIVAPRVWVNPPYHFDSFGDAMLALFVLSTFDNWLSNFAYTGMDMAHQPELQPKRNGNPSQIIFFVAFVCVGGIFILRMFIGIFIDQFGIISGSKLLTERQKLWRDTNRMIQALKPTRLPNHPTGFIRQRCYRIVHSRRFGLFVILVILINYAYILYQQYKVDPVEGYNQRLTFEKVETFFVTLYLVEALIKFLGSEFNDWWHHKWNLVEFSFAMISASCLFPSRDITKRRGKVGAIFYILRIFRVIRYVPQLSSMVATVFVSLPSMVDIISLMGIVLFLFAGIGNNLFANLKNGSCYGGNTSFYRFTTSLMLLFQVTTLDNWSCLITDMSVQQPSCTFGVGLYTSDCGLPSGAIVYLIALVCMTSYIFANLFVAQIIDSITFGLLDENAMITPAHLYQYQKLWAQKEFDYYCIGYIGHHKLREFVNRLGPPLGRRFTFHDKWITRIEYEALNFRSHRGIPFRSLLETLVIYKIGPRGLELPVRIERERQVQELYRVGAAIKIQALGRGYLERKGFYKTHTVQREVPQPMRTKSGSFGSRLMRSMSSLRRQ